MFILDHNIFSYWEADLNAWREYEGRLHRVQGDHQFQGNNAIWPSILHFDHIFCRDYRLVRGTYSNLLNHHTTGAIPIWGSRRRMEFLIVN